MNSMRNILLLSTFFLSIFFAGAQTLTSITPNNAPKGQTLTVTITGANTTFTQSSSTVSFYKSGSPTTVITVNSFTASNLNTIAANITISSAAVTGLYDVYVYDSLDGGMFLMGSFNVSNAGAKSFTITPSTGTKGQTLNVTITGTNTSFLQGSNTITFFGQGTSSAFITNSLTRTSATQMIASITIPPSAAFGAYFVSLSTISDGQLLVVNGFTVATPSINSVSPANALRGNTLTVTITGINTHFLQGSTVLNFFDNNTPQSNLVVNYYTPVSDLVITANVTIPITSPLFAYNLSVTDSIDGFLIFGNAVTIQPGTLTAITPSSALRSQTLNVTITGSGTTFQQGSTTIGFFKSGTSTAIIINSINVNSSNNLTANITVQSNAIVGVYDLRVSTTLDGSQSLNSSFTVTGPVINSVTPAMLNRGTKLALTISGTNTHFNQATGTNVYFFRQGSPTNFITVDSTKAIGATSLTAYISVSKYTPGGIYQLRTFNATDNEIIYSNDIGVAVPLINTVTPNTSPSNETLDVLLTGTGTNFTQASATNFVFSLPTSSGNNIVINSVNALSDSIIKLNVSIISAAPLGNYLLTYTSQFDGILKTNFVVSPAIPVIVSVTPPTAKKGTTLDVLITGQNTSFLQSSTTISVSFMKSGTSTTLIKINTKTIQNDSVIKLNITLDSTSAVLGIYDINVFDSLSGTTLTKTNAFSVLNTGIDEIQYNINRLNIYPNPASQIFTIELNKHDAEVREFLITDITGRKVFDNQTPQILPDGTIHLDVRELNLSKGTYFIRIATPNNFYFSKLLIE